MFLLPALLAWPACGQGGAPLDAIAIAVPYEPTTFDPHARDTVSDFAVLSNIYEPLVATDADMKIMPRLASSWENPDPLSWVFHLRPSVLFQSGRPLTARDVAYSVNRLLGASDLEMKSYLPEILDASVVDERTVRIRTRRTTRLLLNRLNFVLVVPDGSTATSLAGSPDGTGPYAFEDWIPSERIRLVRNPRYWGPPPAIREVALSLGQGPERALEGLLAGRHQLAQCNTKKVEAAIPARGRYKVVKRTNIYVKYLGYDLAREATPFCRVKPNPFKDRRVRQALSAALDRPRLVDRLGADGVPATQLVPRFIFGFDPGIHETLYDPASARSLLRQAGLGEGFEVVLHARRIVGEAALLVKEQLAEVGIKVDARVVPDDVFFPLLDRQGASFWLSRVGCPTGDGSQVLDDYVHGRDASRHAGISNWSGYDDAELNRSIEASSAIENDAARRAAVEKIMKRVMDELVLIPLYNDEDVYVMDRRLAWQPRNDSYLRAAEIGLAPYW